MSSGQEPLFSVDQAPASPPSSQSLEQPGELSSYRVLARQYRPQRFGEVIGQETTVALLQKGLASQKLGHGLILTGIRGVGKTTLARLVAKALSCSAEKRDSVDPCGTCESCEAMAKGRHFDIIEMDAASHTGVDDMREIIDSSRYRALSGRYKIFIIDEVHMLSKSAFNALLKTLEEPPSHVKFIFATTEIQKVPATIISRCLRFDLKRIQPKTLQAHLQTVCELEGFQAEPKALWAIAQAADGSVRDSLSMLDQAILLASEHDRLLITLQAVQSMLGTVDPTPFLNLFEGLLKGEVETVLILSRELYHAGADALLLVDDLLNLCHQLSLQHLAPTLLQGAWVDDETANHLKSLTENVSSFAHLNRMWQMLLKGREEVKLSTSPFQALEMILARIAYLAHFPTPETLTKILTGEEPPQAVPNASPCSPESSEKSYSSGSQPDPFPTVESKASQPSQSDSLSTHIPSFEACVKLVAHKREGLLYTHLKEEVHPIEWLWGKIRLSLKPSAPEDLIPRLKQFLRQETGQHWEIQVIPLTQETAPPTLKEQEREKEQALIQRGMKDPLVQKAHQLFPGMTLQETQVLREDRPALS